MSRISLMLAGSALTLSATIAAQTLPIPLGNSSIVPQDVPAPVPTPTPFPSPVFTPAPAARPTARPTPRPTAAPTTRPAPRATPVQGRPTPTPTPRPTASATPIPQASPSSRPSPQPTPSATAAPAIETVVLPQQPHEASPLWPWFAGGAAVLLALAALLLRRRTPTTDEMDEEDLLPAPVPAPASGRLEIELRPTRAGVNLITATVDAEVVVTNIGTLPASDVRVGVTLLGAGAAADAALDAVAARAVKQAAVPPFTLAPGAERRFRAIAALPHEAIEPLEVAGRPMFVPLVAVSAQWIEDGAPRRVTRGFAVGVERVDSAKLAPLWLDVPPRSYDTVAARPHGAAREST